MKEIELVEFQISLSTAEIENNLFSGYTPLEVHSIDYKSFLPEGKYRVIDGELYRIISGMPPNIHESFVRK